MGRHLPIARLIIHTTKRDDIQHFNGEIMDLVVGKASIMHFTIVGVSTLLDTRKLFRQKLIALQKEVASYCCSVDNLAMIA